MVLAKEFLTHRHAVVAIQNPDLEILRSLSGEAPLGQPLLRIEVLTRDSLLTLVFRVNLEQPTPESVMSNSPMGLGLENGPKMTFGFRAHTRHTWQLLSVHTRPMQTSTASRKTTYSRNEHTKCDLT